MFPRRKQTAGNTPAVTQTLQTPPSNKAGFGTYIFREYWGGRGECLYRSQPPGGRIGGVKFEKKRNTFGKKKKKKRRLVDSGVGPFGVRGGGRGALPAAVSVLLLMNGGPLQGRKVRR